MFKKFYKWLLSFFAFPKRKKAYGLTISNVKADDDYLMYIDITYTFKVYLKDGLIGECIKWNLPYNLILADKFRKEIDKNFGDWEEFNSKKIP